jgi:hypothetical protein
VINMECFLCEETVTMSEADVEVLEYPDHLGCIDTPVLICHRCKEAS